MPRATIDRFEQRKQTRGRLIEAALQLFSTSGYEHATVDDISHAAGYSKGAYYFHFSTKDDILLELLRMWTEGRSAVFAEDDVELMGADDLRLTLSTFFSYEDDPRWHAVLLEFWSQAVRHSEISRRLTAAYSGWRKKLAAAFSAAAADGLLIESADDAASMALAAHDGYAVQIAIGSPGGAPLSPAELAESILVPLRRAATGQERRASAV